MKEELNQVQTINDAIKTAMKREGCTQNMMQRHLGYKSASQVSARLTVQNWSVDRIYDYLDLLGYEVVIRPKRKPSSEEIVIKRGEK